MIGRVTCFQIEPEGELLPGFGGDEGGDGFDFEVDGGLGLIE